MCEAALDQTSCRRILLVRGRDPRASARPRRRVGAPCASGAALGIERFCGCAAACSVEEVVVSVAHDLDPASTAVSRPAAVRRPVSVDAAGERLDKHRLDVALSAGRQAAERARLAGIPLLIGLVPPSMDALAEATGAAHRLCPVGHPVPPDPYSALALECAQHAVLVGLAIAAAQMGIRVCLPGPIGARSLTRAMRLNPGVRVWCNACFATLRAACACADE
jgi:hypothetical protein